MKRRVLTILALLCALIGALLALLYFFILPFMVSNEKVVNNFAKLIIPSKMAEIKIEKPALKTFINSDIYFTAAKILISKDNKNIFEMDNLKTGFNLKGLLSNKLIVKDFQTDYIFVDSNKLMDVFTEDSSKNKKQNNNDMSLDLYDSILQVKKGLILYSPNKAANIKLDISNIFADNREKIERFIHFDIKTEINTPNDKISFTIKDNNKVVIKNKHLYVDDVFFNINNSKIKINAQGSKEKGLVVNAKSNKFKIEDIRDLIETNLIIPNGYEILSYFKDLRGDFDIDINLEKEGINGLISLNKGELKLVPLNNMPLVVNKGEIQIDPKNLTLKDFEGYYGKNEENKAKLNGTVKDYLNKCIAEITIDTKANSEFAKDYLTKTAGIPIEITGQAGTRIIINSILDKIDITWMSKLAKGDDILVDGASLTPVSYDRAVKAEMHVEGKYFDIKELNYYIANEIKKGMKIKPVVTLRGRFDITKEIPEMKVIGFEVPNPLPSEFLNVLIGQKLFSGGKFAGKLYYDGREETPVIIGKIDSNDIKIPSQRLYIKEAKLNTDKDTIHIASNGRFKRSNFVFTGDIKSAVTFPIVIRNLNFELDELDLEKLMASFNQAPNTEISTNNEKEDEDIVTFDFNNLIIEKCAFKLKNGSFKNVKFGNLIANLTLKDNKLDLHSNKFDIAEGISTIKVLCDLTAHKYYLRLGVKDVNSDVMSTALLNLPREISGKASGLIEINTDDTMKLNGQIKFAVNNGQIQKIGLVEYLMKFAALFRNPVVTISPSIVSDIVNIPEGNFDKINGELYIKNNFVEYLKIQSKASGLSSYIVGCYNLENSDAILRIYTKFSSKNKGVNGFLRKISLSSLANRIPLNSKNDENYYASELKKLPPIDADEKDCQIFLTTVDGDIEHNNFISSLKKIK